MRVVRIAMIVALALLMGWFVWSARESIAAVDWRDPKVIGAIAVMLLAWVAGQCAAGAAWWLLLGRAIGLRQAVGILLTTQIGKYLPGNVGQFVGRAYLGRRHGLTLPHCGATMTAEILLSIGLGLGVAVLMAALDPVGTEPLADFLPGFWVLTVLGGGVVGVLGALLFFPDRIGRLIPAGSRLRKLVPPPLPAPALALAICLHMGLYVILASGLWLVLPVFAGEAPVPFSVTFAVFGVATVTGLVTPGAPGGLGVREAVIVAGLAPFMAPDTAIVIALALRAATVLGDLAIFAIGWLLLPRGGPADVGAASQGN